MFAAHIPRPAHTARRFDRLPDGAEARRLLATLAQSPCRFAPAKPAGPIALYGAGSLGRLARDFLKQVGHELALVIDRDAERIAADPEWAGVRLVPPSQASHIATPIAVSVVTSPYVPLERTLHDLGVAEVVPFYDFAESFRHRHPLSNGWFAPPLTADDFASTAAVLERWHDDMSRAHHLQFLAWRRMREEWTFAEAPVVQGRRYFVPEVAAVLTDAEYLIDAGAHHGAVTAAFAKLTSGRFRGLAAIEPDSGNRTQLAAAIERLFGRDLRVTILDCALAEGDGEGLFHAGLGHVSQLSPTGRDRVSLRRLDSLRLAPTFIKLHLEGGELAALKGARDTLRRHRPIVAATVYHNSDGIWKTPLWLMQELPDYKFLFRLDAWCGTGAVVYAIPNERQT